MWVTSYINAVKLGLVKSSNLFDEDSYYEKLRFDDYESLNFEIIKDGNELNYYTKFLNESLYTLGYFDLIQIDIDMSIETNRRKQLDKFIDYFSNSKSYSYVSYILNIQENETNAFFKFEVFGDSCSLNLECNKSYVPDDRLKQLLLFSLPSDLVEKLLSKDIETTKIEFSKDCFYEILDNSWLFEYYNVNSLSIFYVPESRQNREWSCSKEDKQDIISIFELFLPLVKLSSFEFMLISLRYHTPPYMLEKRVTPEEFRANIEGKKIRKKAPKFSRRSLGYLDDDDADAWRLGVASCMGKDYVFIDHKHAIEESDIPDRIEKSIDKWTYTKDLKSFFKKEF